jgi:para-aminobenzoate synthetase component I
MHPIEMSADEVVSALLGLSATEVVCILDSCGVGHLGSHLLIAGVGPVSVTEMSNDNPELIIAELEMLTNSGSAVFFSMSYDLGARLQGITLRHHPERERDRESDLFAACFESLIIHDYTNGTTYISGKGDALEIDEKLRSVTQAAPSIPIRVQATSDFTKDEYLAAIETIKERIRSGDTYQTNLTQQFTVQLGADVLPQTIFRRLRDQHPAPFAAFLKRTDTAVVSASPERFFRASDGGITASPIKGTRERSPDHVTDERLRKELLSSEKDIAENTMIVDLLRNDLGRVCKFGSVEVERLCDLEEHPTLFHLVSTINGELLDGITVKEIVRALYPCGSITGAPKISTMQMIDELEPSCRGLSMGAIGYYVPAEGFGLPETLETSVAIRTMVIHDGTARFNVGGGIVIDSDPESEYRESLTKAKALFGALNAEFDI